MRFLPSGDAAVVVEFGSTIDLEVSAQVSRLASRLEARRLEGVVELLPTFRSLMICYDPLVVRQAEVIATVTELADTGAAESAPARLWTVPACYASELAPDLAEVAERTKLSPDEVVRRHVAVTYHVFMLGFLPGLAYLGDVPSAISLPRRQAPRRSIPAGSVGIAAGMTAIYPRETPCGWHLIGRSPARLWDLERSGRALLTAGDKVEFAPISLREYERESARMIAGVGRAMDIGNVA